MTAALRDGLPLFFYPLAKIREKSGTAKEKAEKMRVPRQI